MNKTKHQEHPFPALYDQDSRILILGSFPSVKSREENFFYGHPRNRFWAVTAGLLSEKVPETIEEKKDFLTRNHIALWDVIKSCEIHGSSDSSIKNVVPNDLSEILKTANIRRIYCNGATSYGYYRKFQEKKTGMEAVKLPSTSPANAAFSKDRLIQEWKEICDPLQAARPGLGKSLLSWYDYNKRTLPWRSDPSPYHVWISEIMLQQTRVEAVIGYYDRFMERYPTVLDLANGEDEELLKLWEGLGYYSRARNIKKAALEIRDNYGGKIPSDYETLIKLPGIGDYTAGAIASIAFDQRQPAIDGNVLRVYSRLLGQDGDLTKTPVRKGIRREVLRTMSGERPGDFNQALMDLGATVCLPNGQPKCQECPWDTACLAHRQSREMDFPRKKKKKGRRLEDKTILRIEYGGKVAIHKRAEKGLLAGLWEFPNLEGIYSISRLEELLKEWGIQDCELTNMGEGKHIFSHVEWHMTGFRIVVRKWPEDLEVSRDWIFADARDLDQIYAIPSAFRIYL